MDARSNSALRLLDRRLQITYRNAANSAIRDNRAAIAGLTRFDESQYPGYDESAMQSMQMIYANWRVNEASRPGGLLPLIVAAMAVCGISAGSAIQREYFTVYMSGFFVLVGGVNHELPFGVNMPIPTQAQLHLLMEQAPQSPFTQIAFDGLGLRDMASQQKAITLLQGQMRQAIINGDSFDQIVNRIQGFFNHGDVGLNRARMIARTEINRLANQGREAAWQFSNAIGIETEKIWIHTGRSEAPRDDHMDMSGVAADADGYFTLPSGARGRYPGDPQLPAREVINCTCSFVGRVKSPRAVTQSYIDNATRAIMLDEAGITAIGR